MRLLPICARALRLIGVAAFALTMACDSSKVGRSRVVVVHGLPTCPREGRVARPIVVRLDREGGVFDDRYSVQTMIQALPRAGADHEGLSSARLDVVRQRMHAHLRVGLCQATSIATWDCAAATWLADVAVTLDGGADPVDVTVPHVDVGCVDTR